ncbi:MAG: hypothetical protein Q4G03_11650 [Planctomycetia bacterium]|nr:hypothetical protein [Planctomycetia bacterium]
MSWQGVYGYDSIALQFARAYARKRLGGSFLIVAPPNVGKRLFVLTLAKTLLCRSYADHKRLQTQPMKGLSDELPGAAEQDNQKLLESFHFCGECPSCRQFHWSFKDGQLIAPTHQDFHYICKPEDKTQIPLELLIGSKDGKTPGLCRQLYRSAFLAAMKVAVIDDADTLNIEGSNALLKTLEEPPKDTLIFLLGTSAAKQLPTIRSRCQIFRFPALEPRDIEAILLAQKIVDNPQTAAELARGNATSAVEATRALDEDLGKFQKYFLTELARANLRAFELSEKIMEHVDAKGKESVIRRARLREVIRIAIEFYRHALANLGEATPRASLYDSYVQALFSSNGELDLEQLAQCMTRTIDALDQVDRNINIPVIVESWLYDLRRIDAIHG